MNPFRAPAHQKDHAHDPTGERANRRLPSPEVLKLFVELDAPTNRDLEVARDRSDECCNLADTKRV